MDIRIEEYSKAEAGVLGNGTTGADTRILYGEMAHHKRLV